MTVEIPTVTEIVIIEPDGTARYWAGRPGAAGSELVRQPPLWGTGEVPDCTETEAQGEQGSTREDQTEEVDL